MKNVARSGWKQSKILLVVADGTTMALKVPVPMVSWAPILFLPCGCDLTGKYFVAEEIANFVPFCVEHDEWENSSTILAEHIGA
jgi:hypothetical protein